MGWYGVNEVGTLMTQTVWHKGGDSRRCDVDDKRQTTADGVDVTDGRQTTNDTDGM